MGKRKKRVPVVIAAVLIISAVAGAGLYVTRRDKKPSEVSSSRVESLASDFTSTIISNDYTKLKELVTNFSDADVQAVQTKLSPSSKDLANYSIAEVVPDNKAVITLSYKDESIRTIDVYFDAADTSHVAAFTITDPVKEPSDKLPMPSSNQ